MENKIIAGSGFHHVAIRTANWDASIRFYTEGLGFNQKITWGEAPRRAVMLDTGDGNYLEIFERDAIENGPDDNRASILHFALRATDCASRSRSGPRGGSRSDARTESS